MRRGPLLALMSCVAAAAACGSRTGLLLPDEIAAGDDSGAMDSGTDFDSSFPEDARMPRDAPPPIDVVHLDAFNDCPDAGSTYVYVVSAQNTMLSYYPPTNSFRTVGRLACPAPPGYQPFSMAIDRTGVAYVLYENGTLSDGKIYRVSTLNGACTPTAFSSGANAFPPSFGMGFSYDGTGTSETLYLAGDPTGGVSVLGSLSTVTFAVTRLAPFPPNLARPELTGTGGGQLFAFFQTSGGADSAIAEIDKKTAQVLQLAPLPGVMQGGAWAFGFWGGDFYTFTAPGGSGTSSEVTRYRPSDRSIVHVGATPGLTIVGAGVSTCAPQQ